MHIVLRPGEPMVLQGTVGNADGTPAAGIIVYAYHTDHSGVYPKAATAHGRLRAWAQTDRAGKYCFDSIRPAAYPSREIPQHMHVIEPGKATYYIDEILFEDDPLLTKQHRQQLDTGRGGSGVIRPARDADGVWHVQRDITLGKNIPGYR